MTCAMKREAWTWYLPSHLVPAKILCSRCEPCTKIYCSTDPAYMYFLWSRALMSAPNTICYLIRSKNKLTLFTGNDGPTAFIC